MTLRVTQVDLLLLDDGLLQLVEPTRDHGVDDARGNVGVQLVNVDTRGAAQDPVDVLSNSVLSVVVFGARVATSHAVVELSQDIIEQLLGCGNADAREKPGPVESTVAMVKVHGVNPVVVPAR